MTGSCVKNEEEKVNEFIENIDSKLVGTLDRDEIVVVAEEDKKTVLEAFPESLMAKEYEVLADNLLKACGYKVSEGNLEKLNNKKVKSDNKDESSHCKKEEAKC